MKRKGIRKLKLEELGRVNIQTYQSQTKIPVVVVLDNIRSGLNVGSFFRTSDAFSVGSIYLCGITPTPPHKEILKSAIGATQSVQWEYCPKVSEALEHLSINNYQILGVEQTTSSIDVTNFKVNQRKKYALIFGNEVEGLSDVSLKHIDAAIEIPQFGTKHSLNVSVCAGIILWEFLKSFRSVIS